MTSEELSKYLKKANQIQSFESIIKERIDSSVLPKYYKDSGVLYRRYHSPEGAMHLPIKISEDERHKHKLLFQARSVEEQIIKHNYKTVVELGCGNGFNSMYLARKFPEVQFTAMDITEANLEVGKKMAEGLNNLSFKKFNFDMDPHTYKADVVFAVETFCYSGNLTELFRKIFQCLNENGKLIVFDGYVKAASVRPVLTADEEKANTLLCWGFALKNFQGIEQVYTAIKENNLDTELEYDYSTHILPSYKTFQKASLRLLRFPLLTRLLLAMGILPKALFQQSLSGLFGAYMVERNYMGYYQFVLQKGNS